MLKKISVPIIAGFLFASAFTGRATVTMTFQWSQSYWQSGFTVSAPFNIISADAIGVYHFTTGQQDGVPKDFWSVCLSPAGVLDTAEHSYDRIQFADANPGQYPDKWAWNGNSADPQYWGINNVAYLWKTYGMGIVAGGPDQSQRGAALEFAIWTALYNSTGYGTLGGSLFTAPTGQMSATTLSYYNQYIAALTGSGITGPQYLGDILRGTSPDSRGQQQEFLILGAAVPEASTVISGALLLLSFGASVVRVLRKKRV